MKKKIHLGKLEKLVILVMVVTLAVSILPQLDIQQLFAEDPPAVTLELKEGNITRPLSVNTTDAKAVEAVLLKDSVEAERKILNTNTPAQFDITQNGTYVIQSIDVQGTVLEEHEQIVEGLTDLYVDPSEAGSLNLYGRIENTDHITVTFKEQKEAVKVEKQANGLYQGSYTPKENGSYVFQSEAADGSALGAATAYDETGIAEQKPEESKKEEPQEVKEYHITNEQGLKDIAKAPDKTYILDGDITVTSNEILINREFTGILEGNGHVIKGLKQPLFSSLNKATIKNISLSSEISSNGDTAALAVSAKDTNINGVGILATIDSSGNASGMIVNSNNSIIEHSYVSGKITGEAGASGFVVSGSAAIKNSYVTGIVEGKQSAYGFGKQTDITNSYAAVYVEGKESGNFNAESKKLEGSFYDISTASIEEPRSQEYTSVQLVSGSLSITDFQQTKGSYPSLKKEITDKYSEEAKKLSALSTLAVSTQSSLLGIKGDIALPSETQKEAITWEATGNIGINGNTLLAKVSADPDKDTSGELIAATKSGTRTLKAASARVLMESPVAGESLAEEKTQISFNMKERLYYKVTTTAAEEPTSHKAAIENGWKRYLWSDVINWSELNWNTEYILNEYDMTAKTLKTYPIKTKKGLVGGSVSLSDTYKVDTEITATLQDAQCDKGSWAWEKSKSLSSGWTQLKTGVDANSKTSTYTPTTDDSGYFIRTSFTVSSDQNYEGTVTKSGATVIKEELNGIKIYKNSGLTVEADAADMVVGNQLYAKLTQDKFDADVIYTWHQKDSDGTDNDEKILGTGKSYLLSGKDVDQLIYVKATAKKDGGASGAVKAAMDTKVKKAKTAKITEAPEIVSKDDISITVKMPDSYTKGLYQFGYIEDGIGGEPTPFDTLARGNNEVTIRGLKSLTSYYIKVRQIGEDGYEDSVWSDVEVQIETDLPHVTGTVEITVNQNKTTAYGETLKATRKNGASSETGSWIWNWIKSDGSKVQVGTGYTYYIGNVNTIGCKLEAVYKGTGNYSGEISAQSEIVKKAEVSAPINMMVQNKTTTTDSSIIVELPMQDESEGALGNNEKFIIGYSLSENGVPVEYRETGSVMEYEPSSSMTTRTATLNGLTRNTTYYIFLRYAEQEEHYKSDWSSIDTSIKVKTKQTVLQGSMHFTYANTSAANPIQGEKLVAVLDGANVKEGTWAWTKVQGGVESNITNFFPQGDDSTYYMIPATEAVGTTYKVTFTPVEGFSGNITETSTAVQKYTKDQYDAPTVSPQKKGQTDTTLSFRMADNADEGVVYEFQYGKDNSEDAPANKLVDTKAYKGADVTITGLDRNTTYYIWVRRAKDDNYEASAWCLLNLEMKTELTGILGYVSIEGIDTAGKELTASYHKANYIPTGEDTNGTWRWYRENDGSYIEITTGIIRNKTISKYMPTGNDIGKKLKAVYTGSGDFNGDKEAVTSSIKKNVATDPEITTFTQGSDVDNHLRTNVVLSTNENVWYRMQNDTISAPNAPTGTTEGAMTAAGWTKAPSTSFQLTQDYQNAYFEANAVYTLYIVKQETADTQVSNVLSKSVELGSVTQSGTIAFTGNEVVGKTVTATLKNANNNKGTWKWYISATDCGATGTDAAPSISDTAKWKQLASGYNPTIDSDTSTLTISEDMWKYYIKAEFVSDSDIGYGGDSIKSVDNKFVKKIYNEELILTSSTENGNGSPSAYSGTKITAKVKNWSGESLSSRLKAYINESTRQQLSGVTISNDTLNVTLSNMSVHDGRNVFAELNVPTNIMLYVDENMNTIAAGKMYTSNRIVYRYGVPINNANDFENFMKQTGAYTNRGASDYYIITNHINMTSKGIVAYSENAFSGTLDGDYHIITGTKNPIFARIQGSSTSNPANVKNLIINSANVNTKSLPVTSTSSASVLSRLANKVNISRVVAVNSDIYANWDAGILIGLSDEGGLNISECGTAGGYVEPDSPNARGVGGFAGWVDNGSSSITNSFSINTKHQASGVNTRGGFLGGGGYLTVKNSFAASQAPFSNSAAGGLMPVSRYSTVTNSFFDNVLAPGSHLSGDGKGIGKSTKDMTGTGLQSAFGNSGIWNYTTGYYPRLTWFAENSISKLYAATRGAFTSVVANQTNATDIFNGNISGAIKIPEELQANSYSIKSSDPNILRVTAGGTIIPIGAAGKSATITITYTEPDAAISGTASNTYDFTVKQKVNALASVSVSGTTNPGKVLTATASGAGSYQWYRRKSGTVSREAISGATKNMYTLKPSDVGYEFNVDVGASGYATMSSGFTAAVTSVKPSGLTVSDKSDNGVTVKADGISGADYEYAYAVSTSGDKIIAGHSTSDFKITGLSRNKDYWLYARVSGAADGSYAPSDWTTGTQIKTEKTDIEGPIKINGVINAGSTLTASIADTNLQKGSWKIERIKNGTPATLTPKTSTVYGLTYELSDEDAGSKIKITYSAIADTDFDKSVSIETDSIMKRSQEAPSQAPSEVTAAKKDHSLQVQENIVESGTTYEFGYRKSVGEDIELVSGGGVAAETPVTISGLERNTTYYIYVRKAGKDLYEPSAWSPAVQMTTDRSSVQDNTVSVSGTPKVNQTLTFTAGHKDDDTKDQTGMWILERVGSGVSNTLLPTTTSADTHTITYKLIPEDSGYQIKASYIGTGNYKDECGTASADIENDSQTIGSVLPAIGTVDEYSIGVKVTSSSDDTYEFGYKKDGDSAITPYPVTAAWGKEVAITPLTRDSAYTLYVRKAAKTGYAASDWSSGIASRTLQSTLSGNITYTGTTGVKDTLEITYEKGKYPYSGDDSKGSWQWQLDRVNVPAEKGGNSNKLYIEPVDGNPEVTVTYTAEENSGFQGSVTRSFGNVFKKAYEVPKAPVVTANGEDDTREGSVLHLESSEVDDVYYYLRLASDDKLPALKAAKDVEQDGSLREDMNNVERWLKAAASMDIRVPANRTYVVYAARLETNTNVASEINSTRGKLSAKEPLLRNPQTDGQIKESDSSVVWKTLQEKTLQYSLYGKAPTATWKYYVTKTPDNDASWQNIDAELKALGRVDEVKDDVSYSTFEVPLKYTDYHLKATLTGTDDYSGQVEFITPKELEGTLIKGNSSITHSDTYSLLDTLTAEYQGTDDKSGTFYWYRKKDGKDPALVKKDAPGTTSSYQTQEADFECYIYAVYVAAPSGQFSGESITDSVYVDHKAAQNTPAAPEILQINGNSIQFKAPANYNPSGMDKIPQVQIGYQKVKADGTTIDAGITWQDERDFGENWFKKLDRRSSYQLYARFLGTSVYAPSDISAASDTALTENELFDETGLHIAALSKKNGSTDSDTGNMVRMTFTGDGYDEGYFRIRRSNGETIAEQVSDPVLSGNSISYTYTYTAEDVGSYIIIDYIAKDSAKRYEGTITKSNKLVITKPDNPDAAVQPVLQQDLDTNLYVDVQDGYEYYLSSSSSAPLADSGDWDTLTTITEGEHIGQHEFTNLKRTTTYYLHARIAETKEFRHSTTVTSEGLAPSPFIDFKTTNVENTDTKLAAVAWSEAVPFPSTLKKGTVHIEDMSFIKETDDKGDLIRNDISLFTDTKGNATDAVYERGSRWGNKNFATEIILYDKEGDITDRTRGTKTTLDATHAETMKLAVYRVNAISDPGPYVWQATLKDTTSEEITALLKGNVTMTTQMNALVPKEIRMNLDGQFIRQSTNNAALKNDTSMPITIGVDRLAVKGDGMPSLMGVMKGGIAMIQTNEAYLKMSNDGSNFTDPKNGAWFHTEAVSQKEDLFLMGRGSRADYYVSGAGANDQVWPWPDETDKEIREAYKIRFITSISEEDVATYEKKLYEIREE